MRASALSPYEQQELARGRCPHCGRSVLLVRLVHAPSHPRHLLLSVTTLGLWLPAWILAVFRTRHRAWECAECGRSTHGSQA